jgi:hypothetical protein
VQQQVRAVKASRREAVQRAIDQIARGDERPVVAVFDRLLRAGEEVVREDVADAVERAQAIVLLDQREVVPDELTLQRVAVRCRHAEPDHEQRERVRALRHRAATKRRHGAMTRYRAAANRRHGATTRRRSGLAAHSAGARL